MYAYKKNLCRVRNMDFSYYYVPRALYTLSQYIQIHTFPRKKAKENARITYAQTHVNRNFSNQQYKEANFFILLYFCSCSSTSKILFPIADYRWTPLGHLYVQPQAHIHCLYSKHSKKMWTNREKNLCSHINFY